MANKITETPLMKQYEGMKRKHPDAILLFRVGDFYETFSNDAVKCANILGITLTRRGNDASNYVELTGFPHNALNTYLPKLVRARKRVAICEQIESPLIQKKMKSKTAVTEVVVPHQSAALGPAGASSALPSLARLVTPAKAEPVNKLPVTKAVEEVKKAVAPICQQLTQDFAPDY